MDVFNLNYGCSLTHIKNILIRCKQLKQYCFCCGLLNVASSFNSGYTANTIMGLWDRLTTPNNCSHLVLIATHA